ncbi:TRAP transporter small permease [Sneathiella sp.]|uniref:TRAP transporter small permease n=1 Tax=Sneathiella sp. TaxID=1964365 RepID=UPI0039E5908E
MRLSKFYDGLLVGCGVASAVAIFTIVVLVSINVMLRKFFHFSIPWTIEVSEYALYFSTFIAAPWALAKNAHIRVDLLANALTGRASLLLESATNVVGFLVSIVFLVYGIVSSYDSWSNNAMIFKELIIAEWLLLAIIPISAFLLSVEFIRRLLRAVSENGGKI